MSRLCIICRNYKEDFNSEHVILATIGGNMEIDSVCRDCNANLGKTVNIPFLKSPLIACYRHFFKLNRPSKGKSPRGITNPLKKATIEGADGAKQYRIEFKDGQAFSQVIPQIKETPTENGTRFEITAPSMEDIEKIKRNILKKGGINEEDIEVINVQSSTNPPLKARIRNDNRPIHIEGLKMAYEFSVTVLPQYYDDDLAKVISAFLCNKEHSDLIEARFESAKDIFPLVEKEYNALKQIPDSIHGILLKQVESLGLVCFVKIFDMVIPYHISESQYFSDHNKLIAVFNDSLQKSYQWVLNIRWKDISLNIGLEGIDESDKAGIVAEISADANSISTNENCITLYTRTGEIVTPNLAEAIPHAFFNLQNMDFVQKRILVDVNFPPNELFIKHVASNTLLPLDGFKAEYSIVA